MRSKGTRINRYSQHGHAVVACCITSLLVETWGCNDNRWNAQFLGYDTGACLLGGADATTTITGNDGIYLQIDETLTERLC